MKRVDEIEIIADAGQRLLLDAADIALVAEQIMERERHRDIISERRAGEEQDRASSSRKGRKAFFSLRVEAGRDEQPDLAGDDREGDHQGGEEGDLDLDEEGLEERGVDDAGAGPAASSGWTRKAKIGRAK